MKAEQRSDYFQHNPSGLERLRSNEKCFGLCKLQNLFQLAEAEGFKFERFDHLDILRTAVWVEEIKLVERWEFNNTYRARDR